MRWPVQLLPYIVVHMIPDDGRVQDFKGWGGEGEL